MTELWVEYMECPECHQKHRTFLLDREKQNGTMYCNVTAKSFILNNGSFIEYIPQSEPRKDDIR